MGREVEKALLERGHTVVARVDPVNPAADGRALERETAAGADVAIEFSSPDVAVSNIRRYAELGLSAVVGTTGWYDELQVVRAAVAGSNIGLVYGPNFSLGAHVFLAVVAEATRRLDTLPQYDVSILEIHHRRKKDSPSGTARSVADVVLASSTRKRRVVTERLDRAIRDDELHVASVRGGEVPGVHTVLFDSAADTIEVTHTARNRGGFAVGAVMAAEWIRGRRGLYEVTEFVRELVARASPPTPKEPR